MSARYDGCGMLAAIAGAGLVAKKEPLGAPFLSVCKIADAVTTGISFSKKPSPCPASHFLDLKIEIPPLYRKLYASSQKTEV